MPLYTRIERNGEDLPIGGSWSAWHIMRLVEAIEAEAGKGADPFPYGFVFQQDHVFRAHESQIWMHGWDDQEYVFEIKAGDIYFCHR